MLCVVSLTGSVICTQSRNPTRKTRRKLILIPVREFFGAHTMVGVWSQPEHKHLQQISPGDNEVDECDG